MVVLTAITSELKAGITAFCPLTIRSEAWWVAAIPARTRDMLRSPLIWYLATLFASLGLLGIIALDVLRGRPTDHRLPRNFASAGASGTGALKAQKAETKQPVVDASSHGVQPRAFHADTAHPAASPWSVLISPPSPETPAPASVPRAQMSAPWPSVTVTSSIAGSLSNGSSAHERNPNDCSTLWDRETHMPKEEWRAACRRIPGQP